MIDEKKLDKEIAGWFKEAIDNGHYEVDTVDTSAVVRHIIDKQPRVGEWIPCSERLPEESGKYLGQRPYGEIIDIMFLKKHQKWNANDSCPPKYAMEIVAWMPLPEPYKEDTNGEND